jgi:hypothetical protein
MTHLSRLANAAAFFAVALVHEGASAQCTAPFLVPPTAEFTLIRPSYPMERRTATTRGTLRVLSTLRSPLKRHLHLADAALATLEAVMNLLRNDLRMRETGDRR